MQEIKIGEWEGFVGKIEFKLAGKDYWVDNLTTTKGHKIFGPCVVVIDAYPSGIDVHTKPLKE